LKDAWTRSTRTESSPARNHCIDTFVLSAISINRRKTDWADFIGKLNLLTESEHCKVVVETVAVVVGVVLDSANLDPLFLI